MNTQVEIDGRSVAVSVEPTSAAGAEGGRFRVTLHIPQPDGRVEVQTVDVDARPTELGLTMVDRSNGRVVDATLSPRTGGPWLVQLPGLDLDVVVDPRRAGPGSDRDGPSGTGELLIRAPMPGRVLRVLVKAGDLIKARQGAVVVEAMKMENELASPRDGRVREIHVTEGISVEAGRLLVTIE